MFAPLQIGGRLHPEWALYFEQIPNKAVTQTDAVIHDPPTQDDLNGIVATINALIDKLQAADLME